MPIRRPSQIVLIYCEGGFAERALGDVHMLLAKPGNRRAPLVSPLTWSVWHNQYTNLTQR